MRQVFISYSHDDRSWFDRLKLALAPFENIQDIAVLDDTQILPGGRWAEIIDSYLLSADVAVVLTSANLLASGFVRDVELPAIVDAAKSGRLTLVWVAVSSSSWQVTELKDFQAALDPNRPLDLMSVGEANAALVSLAQAVASARTLTQIGRSLKIMDRVAEATADEGAPPPRVFARHTGESVTFESSSTSTPIEMITGEDLKDLPTSEHLLVRALEESMESSFERWTDLRGRSNRLTGRERAEYQEAGQQMCGELRNILDFIEGQLGKYLDDHYRAMRYACERLVMLPN